LALPFIGWTWAWAWASLYFMSSFNFEKTRRKNFKCDGELPLSSLIKTSFT